MSGFDASIAEIARRQHALISVPQALAAGGTRKMLHSRIERGQLELVDVDVLRIVGAPLSWRRACWRPSSPRAREP